MKNAIFLVLLQFVLAQACFAGIKEGGGGVGFLSHEPSGDRVYLADTYDLVKNGALNNNESLNAGIIFLAAGQQFTKAHIPGVNFKDFLSAGWALMSRASFMHWQKEGHLPLLGDDHIPPSSVPANCEKVQIAIQDLKTATVHLDESYVAKMTKAETGFFMLHETLIALRNDPGADTTPIRDEVSSVLAPQEFTKFVQEIINPNLLLPLQTDLEPYEEMISHLEGEYSGLDPLKKACHVSVSRDGDNLNFVSQVMAADGSVLNKLEATSIPVAGLVQKLAYDTSLQKQRPDYSGAWLNVNYYAYNGLPSLFGTYPTQSGIGVSWYKGQLESMNVEHDVSRGPFRDPNKSDSILCYSLSKIK
jgi:hypothetical protein